MALARPEAGPKTPLAARLRELRRIIGDPDREDVANAIGVSKSTLASYERGDSEPTASALSAYRDTYGADLVWLLTGEGAEPVDPSRHPTKKITLDPLAVQRLVDTMDSMSQSIDNIAQRLEPPLPPPTMIRYVPLHASAGGGAAVLYEAGGSEMDMDRLARDVFAARPKDILLMRIKGDSMEDVLKEGDFAVIDTSRRDPEDGHVYVVSINGELYAKRADGTDPDHYFVWRSDNHLHAPIPLMRAEMDSIRVIGEVLSTIRTITPRQRRS